MRKVKQPSDYHVEFVDKTSENMFEPIQYIDLCALFQGHWELEENDMTAYCSVSIDVSTRAIFKVTLVHILDLDNEEHDEVMTISLDRVEATWQHAKIVHRNLMASIEEASSQSADRLLLERGFSEE